LRLIIVISFILSLVSPALTAAMSPAQTPPQQTAVALDRALDLDCIKDGHQPTDTDHGAMHHFLHCAQHVQAPVRLVSAPSPTPVPTKVTWFSRELKSDLLVVHLPERPPQTRLSFTA